MFTARLTAYFSVQIHVSQLPYSPRKMGDRPTRLPLPLILLFVVLALGSQPAQATETDSSAEIVLGMSTVLTGAAANLGKDMQRGVLVGFERENRAGGVNGRKLRLIALDDGYEPTRTAPNMRQLIEKDNVLAVIGNVGTPTAVVAIPLANEEKTLLSLRSLADRSCAIIRRTVMSLISARDTPRKQTR
jgi:ABC-type branched-subunit amino acid transport system substrate-binding protein